MAFTAKDVQTLRERTGVGMMDCKKALVETDGDMEKAIDILREKGLAAAAKKQSRIAAEGLVGSYVCKECNTGALVEVNCETDFVAKTDTFKSLCHDVALQIAAAKPSYVKKEEVPSENLAKEREILRAQALNEGKPEKIVDKMVDGRIQKYYKEVCLIEQPFVKDGDKSISQLTAEVAKEIGANINIVSFERFERGEGIEKRKDNFAEEIAAQMATIGK